METLNYDKSCWAKQCPKVDCKKKECCCGLKYVNVPAALGDDGKKSSVAPKAGMYSNAVVEYEANGHVWVYTNEGVPVEVEREHSGGVSDFDDLNGRPRYAGHRMTSETNIPEVPEAVSELSNDLGFQTADDVSAMISGKQDTLTAGDNITISENGQNQLVISSEDTTYTAGSGLELNNNEFSVDTDTIQPKLTAGANITINSSNEISATDTTYSDFTGATSGEAGTNGLVPAPASGETSKYLKSDGAWDVPTDTTYSDFVGTDGTAAGTAGLVPAPATTDADKFLKADGTWDTAGSPITVVQTIGTSTADVMSQNAVSSMIFNDPSGATQVKIGYISNATGANAVAIGREASASQAGAVAFGRNAHAYYQNSVALGRNSSPQANGEVNIGSGDQSYGYNNSSYRLLSGVYDGQGLHDAATVAQGNTLSTSAPTTSTAGVLGQLYTDTTNMHTYQCTTIDTTDPNNPLYTWTQRW